VKLFVLYVARLQENWTATSHRPRPTKIA